MLIGDVRVIERKEDRMNNHGNHAPEMTAMLEVGLNLKMTISDPRGRNLLHLIKCLVGMNIFINNAHVEVLDGMKKGDLLDQPKVMDFVRKTYRTLIEEKLVH